MRVRTVNVNTRVGIRIRALVSSLVWYGRQNCVLGRLFPNPVWLPPVPHFNQPCQACGARVEDFKNADGGKEGLVLGVKDVADMLDFDEQQVRAVV